jgi:hypothetical protein
MKTALFNKAEEPRDIRIKTTKPTTQRKPTT